MVQFTSEIVSASGVRDIGLCLSSAYNTFNGCAPVTPPDPEHVMIREIRESLTNRRFTGAVVNVVEAFLIPGAWTEMLARWVAASLGEVLPEVVCGDARPMEGSKVEIGAPIGERHACARSHYTNLEHAWPLHTGRALQEDVGDWVLIHRTNENYSSGGNLRLLRIDDFDRLQEFVEHPLAFQDLTWKEDGVSEHGVTSSGLRAPVFSGEKGAYQIRLTDSRFRHPDSQEQFDYLERLDRALQEQADNCKPVYLSNGGLAVFSNRYVLHGREGFNNCGGDERKFTRFHGKL